MKKSSMNAVTKAAGGKPRAPVTSSIDTMRSDERKWKAEDAMRDLMRAEEHKKDKGLMKDVKALAADKVKKMQGLCGKGE